jgi:Na+/proline symporter
VVVTISLVGGSWAVAASDFIQSILILAVAIVASLLCLQQLGGFEPFWDQIPAQRKVLFLEGDFKYDKWWLLAMFIGGLYMNNNLGMTAKYLAAKDSKAASKAAWVAGIGFAVVTPIFFIPAMATFTLVPDLETQYGYHKNPAELSYIASCIAVLPQGMLGLLAACLFSATMSSMDTYLNKVSGFFTQNFYKTIIKKNQVSNEHLMKVGQIVTLVIGIFAIVNAVVLSQSKVPLFDVFQMTNSYLIIPMGIPVTLGLFVKATRRWIPFFVIALGVVITFFIYNDFEIGVFADLQRTWFGEDGLDYMMKHKFAVANLVNIPLLTIIYIVMSILFPERSEVLLQQETEFFKKMHTPIDFEKEVGGDNSHLQAKILGRLLLVYGGFMLLGILIPNEMIGRLAFLGIAILMGGIGGALELSYRRYLKKA